MFTNILNDPYTPELLGTSMIFTIGALLSVAAFVMLSVTFRLLWMKFKLRKATRNSQRGSKVAGDLADQTIDDSDQDMHDASRRKPKFDVNFDSIDHILRPEEYLLQ